MGHNFSEFQTFISFFFNKILWNKPFIEFKIVWGADPDIDAFLLGAWFLQTSTSRLQMSVFERDEVDFVLNQSLLVWTYLIELVSASLIIH